MYNGTGLQTPRGSGGNGYVQSNKFVAKPATNKANKGLESSGEGIARKPNTETLEHDRKRRIELKLLVLEEKLIDQGYTDEEIGARLGQARLALEAKEGYDCANGAVGLSEKFSATQTHQVAALKEKQMEMLKDALGIQPEKKQ